MNRTTPLLDALTTRVKQRVLSATLLQPERSWYLHELARHLHVPPSSVQHELRLFASAGLLTRKEHGNRVYYQADQSSPIFRALSEVLRKTAGLVDVVRDALKPLAVKLEAAFIYGSVAAGEEKASSDVDLMVIGRAPLSEIAGLLRAAEDEVGRNINPMVYTTQEFLKKIKEGHHFLTSVLEKELLFVHGTIDDLAKLTGRSDGEAAQNEPHRVARPSRRRRPGSKRRKDS
jgi:predicted nucleotidyltransferase